MTVIEKIEWFDILQDKFGSPYFNEAQKLVFLNQASMRYIENLFPKKKSDSDTYSAEENSNIYESLKEVIFVLPAVNMDSSGEVSNSSLITALRTVSGDSTCEVFKILAIEIVNNGTKIPLRPMRHNDKAAFETNVFKKPTYQYPRYSFSNNGLQFRPDNAIGDIYITVVKTPRKMTVSPEVSTDLHIDTHNEIVAQALSFAGVASREEILMIMKTGQI